MASVGGHVTRADATSVAPTKIAVIIMENKDYAQVIGAPGSKVATQTAPYTNGVIKPASINIQPTTTGGAASDNCDHVTGETGDATGAVCISGMFPSYRCASGANGCESASTGFRADGSAPEYAILSMGTDADIRDTNFPSGGVARGYSAKGDTSNPVHNIFDYANANSVGYTVYAEDYPGDATTCDTSQWSDSPATGVTHNYYALKHNPYLLTWNQAPNAVTTAGQTPASAPSDAACKAHMRRFPQNDSVNGSTTPAVNFNGTESFGTMTIIVPSMCHDAHNGNGSSACSNGTSDLTTGGVQGMDRWLALNYANIRKDVGPTGVVVLTFDEPSHSIVSDGGTLHPMPTLITAGTDANGNAGELEACQSPPCNDASAVYDLNSVNKSLLLAEGASCTTLNNTNTYQGQSTTARGLCNAATALPTNIHQTATGPQLVQTVTQCTGTSGSCASTGSQTTTLNLTWPAATGANRFLVAAIAVKGTVTGVTAPAGWTQAAQQTAKNITIFVCANCASHSGTEAFTFPENHHAMGILAEFSGVSTSSTSNGSASYSSGATAVSNIKSGNLTTTNASDIAFTALMDNAGTAGPFFPTSGSACGSADVGWDEIDSADYSTQLSLQLNSNVLSSTGLMCSQSQLQNSVTSTGRGVITAWTN